MIEIVFNELSLEKLPTSQQQAYNALNEMVSVVNVLERTHKQKVILRSNTSFMTFILLQDSYENIFSKWLDTLQKDDKSRFLSAITQTPFIRNYPYFLLNEKEVQGFAYAYENDLLSVSYNALGVWDKLEYNLKKIQIEENSEIEEVVKVFHIPNAENHLHFQTYIINRIIYDNDQIVKSIKNSEEFWQKREILFPNLHFCGETKSKIMASSMSDKHFQGIIRKLKILDNHYSNIQHYSHNFFGNIGITISPDSEVTLKQFSAERTFKISDTISKIFSLHIKFGDGTRVYIYPDEESKKCHIGYIGSHLRTVTFQ
jgi:hypothetical protein